MRSWLLRFATIKIAWELIKDAPIFGHGLNQFLVKKHDKFIEIEGEKRERGELHCEPVEILVELGIIGLVLWCFVIGHSIVRGFHQLPLFPIIVSLLVASLFYYPLRRPHIGLIFWVVLGLMIQ
jgi:O-antigen ligase